MAEIGSWINYYRLFVIFAINLSHILAHIYVVSNYGGNMGSNRSINVLNYRNTFHFTGMKNLFIPILIAISPVMNMDKNGLIPVNQSLEVSRV